MGNTREQIAKESYDEFFDRVEQWAHNEGEQYAKNNIEPRLGTGFCPITRDEFITVMREAFEIGILTALTKQDEIDNIFKEVVEKYYPNGITD